MAIYVEIHFFVMYVGGKYAHAMTCHSETHLVATQPRAGTISLAFQLHSFYSVLLQSQYPPLRSLAFSSSQAHAFL